MKLTKEQLKQIIKEELSETDQSLGGSSMTDFPEEEEAFIDATYKALITIGEPGLTRLFNRLVAPSRRRPQQSIEESKKRRTRK